MTLFIQTVLCLLLAQSTNQAMALSPLFTHEDAVADEYLVFFKDTNSQLSPNFIEGKKDALLEAGATIIASMPNMMAIYASFHPDLLNTIRADPAVKFVEENAPIWADNVRSWGLDRIDQRDLPLDNIFSPPTHGAGVHAFIVDSGIRGTHQEFAGRLGVGADMVNDGNAPDQDCHGHGSHVAGTIGGNTAGVANQVTLHPVRVLNCQGSGSIAGALGGLSWVLKQKFKPAVVNMSLSSSLSPSFNEGVANLVKAGFTTVVAAGNNTQNACNYSPASEPLAITVGATNKDDAIASFSNFGSCVDIFGPGDLIYSANGFGDSAYSYRSGTSMASPHVAGAAALFLETNPKAKPQTVALALAQAATVNKISGLGTDSPNQLLFIGQIDNLPPVANAGDNILLQGKSAVELDGSGSTDPKGQSLTFLWTQMSGPSQAAIATPSAAKTLVSNLVAASTPYVFSLTVTNSKGQSQSDQVVVTVNLQPIVNAGSDMTTTANKIVLTGKASDPDGVIKSVIWSKSKGLSVVFSDKNSLVTEVNGLRTGEYIFQLQAMDDRWGTAIDSVKVIVR